MVDRRRHAPSARRLAITPADRPRPPRAAYRGRTHRSLRDIYESDHAAHAAGGRFRWLISTCLAGAIGAIAIFVVIYGSADRSEQSAGIIPSLKRIRETAAEPTLPRPASDDSGLKWSLRKTDRLQMAAGAATTRFVIHESLKQKRNGREYIQQKPYVRIVSRLAAVPSTYADVIPAFNPYKLYGNPQQSAAASTDDDGEGRAGGRSDVSIKVVELLGGILPGEDGQELDNQEVSELIERSRDRSVPDAAEPVAAAAPGRKTAAAAAAEPLPPNTTVLAKQQSDGDEPVDDLERREVRVIKATRGDTLSKVLARTGAETWLARSMVEAAKSTFQDAALVAGQEIHVNLVPSLTEQGRVEPTRFSVFGEGHEHKVTVYRSTSGEFVASATPVAEEEATRAASGDSEQAPSSSLYAGVYASGLMQNMPTDTIQQILRVHASDTDFRRRVKAGDVLELFFDARDDGATDGPPGELLYTSITSGGDSARFYRFRTPDGVVDYYDEQGNNSKKFLMRKPIRGDDVRLTSGFGFRFHPLLGERRMHTGIDWSAPPGTPILASGTGTIEEAGRKGYNGNYVRIRHANGYHTAYSHLSRFAPGTVQGGKVRQGQVIGYVGTTGLSTGNHLHFEVLINNRFVDPLSIQVPRERQLAAKQLADFQKERARIEELMHRAPVLTQSK